LLCSKFSNKKQYFPETFLINNNISRRRIVLVLFQLPSIRLPFVTKISSSLYSSHSHAAENARKSKGSHEKGLLTVLIPAVLSTSLIISVLGYLWLRKRGEKGKTKQSSQHKVDKLIKQPSIKIIADKLHPNSISYGDAVSVSSLTIDRTNTLEILAVLLIFVLLFSAALNTFCSKNCFEEGIHLLFPVIENSTN
jgi:hypothetical protein